MAQEKTKDNQIQSKKTAFFLKRFFQTNKKRKIVLVVLGLVVLAGVIWMVFDFSGRGGPIEKVEIEKWRKSIEQKIIDANYCQKDDDCVARFFPWFEGKDEIRRYVHKEKFDELWKEVRSFGKETQTSVTEYELGPPPVLKCINGKCEAAKEVTPKEEVLIRTDKQEYSKGEEIKITTKNNSTTTIYLLNPFEQIEKFEDGNWQTVAPLWQCPCDALCKPMLRYALEPDKEKVVGWNQSYLVYSNDFKDCRSIEAEPGRYRIYLDYSLKDVTREHLLPTDVIRLYSNEFEIKETSEKKEGESCISDDYCQTIDCSKRNIPGLKEGFKPYCIDGKCKCMCYGCE